MTNILANHLSGRKHVTDSVSAACRRIVGGGGNGGGAELKKLGATGAER